jgi:hypothetical protein
VAKRGAIFPLLAIVSVSLLICFANALASTYAAPFPQSVDVLLATPTAPRLVYPADRRLRINSLFDHNQPGYGNGLVNGAFIDHDGHSVSGSPYATLGASDTNC